MAEAVSSERLAELQEIMNLPPDLFDLLAEEHGEGPQGFFIAIEDAIEGEERSESDSNGSRS